MITEEWREVKGFPCYQISNYGRIKRLARTRRSSFGVRANLSEMMCRPRDNGKGYKYYRFCEDGRGKTLYLHRLVYETYVGDIPEGYDINHKNENKADNYVGNLEIMTHKENCRYGTRNIRSGMKTSKSVICLDTGIVYPSMIEASRQTGVHQGSISNVCKGRDTHANGLRWAYA